MYLNSAKYLDPKNDLIFRKIFGQHPSIIKSFLNSVMPFEADRVIETVKYEDPSLIPDLLFMKNSIVDVRCIDNYGRQFIVEMQMFWTSSFKSRMLFNAGKAYVKQLDKGNKYNELCPVYGLSLVNDTFIKEEDDYYHHYKLSHRKIPEEVIPGIELIFIELPKFKPQTFTEKKIRNLWLRFLTEIDEDTKEISEDLLKNKEVSEALEYLQISAFTKDELTCYEKFWDNISTEKTIADDLEKMKQEVQIMKQEALKNKEEVQIMKQEALKNKKEAQRKQEEAQKKQEEAQKKQEEAQKRVAESQKKEQDAQRKEQELQKRVEDALNNLEKSEQNLEQEMQRAEAELKAKDNFKTKMILKLYKLGVSANEISEELDISIEEVEKIISTV